MKSKKITELEQRIADLERRLAESQAREKHLAHDPAFDMLTKEGLRLAFESLDRRHDEIQYFIYCDLNGIHNLNAEIGEPAVDAKIREAYSKIRKTDVTFGIETKITGRGRSGDEVVNVITGDPAKFIENLYHNLESVGLSGIAASVRMDGQGFDELRETASEIVHTAKSQRITQPARV